MVNIMLMWVCVLWLSHSSTEWANFGSFLPSNLIGFPCWDMNVYYAYPNIRGCPGLSVTTKQTNHRSSPNLQESTPPEWRSPKIFRASTIWSIWNANVHECAVLPQSIFEAATLRLEPLAHVSLATTQRPETHNLHMALQISWRVGEWLCFGDHCEVAVGNADAPIAGFLKASSRMALVVPGLLNDIIYI